MTRRFLTAVILAVLAGCSGYSPTSPSTGTGSTGGPNGGGGGATGGVTGGGGGGTTGGGTTGPAPREAAVIVGNNFFRSGHNGTANTAVDTVAVGGTVTWTWTNTANVPHSIQSIGSPIFRNSTVLTGSGSTYQVTFSAAGTYEYECGVHGAMMTGKIVVR
jgi:plastocyanin